MHWGFATFGLTMLKTIGDRRLMSGPSKAGKQQVFHPLITTGEGSFVDQSVPLIFQSAYPKTIRGLKGTAELVGLNSTNGGRVVGMDFLNHPGNTIESPILQKKPGHASTFLGAVNYAAKRAKSTSLIIWWCRESGQSVLPEIPAADLNSLEFLLEDPDHVIIAPRWYGEFSFLDAHGGEQQATKVMIAGKKRAFRFKTLPAPDTQLVLYLAVPESLQRVPFQIKSIPLE